jgi:putative flippase GtrA
MVARLKTQVVRNARVIKYGIVGVLGVLINLGAMAVLLRFYSPQSWVPSAIANVLSTIVNFSLHNMWTFSDRQHQGMRMVRGFVFYVLMCAVGIFISTVSYVQLIHIAGRLAILTTHLGKSLAPLACQSVAIVLGAAINYVLNKKFTWPQTQENLPAQTAAQAEEVLSSARR